MGMPGGITPISGVITYNPTCNWSLGPILWGFCFSPWDATESSRVPTGILKSKKNPGTKQPFNCEEIHSLKLTANA